MHWISFVLDLAGCLNAASHHGVLVQLSKVWCLQADAGTLSAQHQIAAAIEKGVRTASQLDNSLERQGCQCADVCLDARVGHGAVLCVALVCTGEVCPSTLRGQWL